MKENERGRNRTLKIRLFPEEEELLERKARIAGKNKSDYIRDFILYSEVRSRPIWQDENFRQLLYEINRIGNNINQIAYNSNLKKSTGHEEIYALREQYEALLSLYEDAFIYPESEVENGDNEES